MHLKKQTGLKQVSAGPYFIERITQNKVFPQKKNTVKSLPHREYLHVTMLQLYTTSYTNATVYECLYLFGLSCQVINLLKKNGKRRGTMASYYIHI